MDKAIFNAEALHQEVPQRAFPGTAGEAAFLLGGIGTGDVSLGAPLE